MPLAVQRALPLLAVVALAGCSGADRSGAPPADTSAGGAIAVTSSAFPDGGRIPEEFTCHGGGTSPPLAWTGLPSGTRSVAVVVQDPDAPSGTFVHWVLVGVPAASELAAGTVPPDATQAANSAGGVGWTPPCPPSGTHHYRFTVYALDATVDVADGADPGSAIRSVQDAATAEGTLTGLVSAG